MCAKTELRDQKLSFVEETHAEKSNGMTRTKSAGEHHN